MAKRNKRQMRVKAPLPTSQSWDIIVGVRLDGMEPFMTGGFYDNDEISFVIIMEYEGVVGCSVALILEDGKSLEFKHKGNYTVISGEWPHATDFAEKMNEAKKALEAQADGV